MTGPAVIQVHPLSEVRQRLSGILARFRREDAAAEPVAFGSHRKPEAILLPYEVYERYEELLRQHARLDSALNAAQSVQVELPGPFARHRRVYRRSIKARGHLPAEQAALKCLYMVIRSRDPTGTGCTQWAVRCRLVEFMAGMLGGRAGITGRPGAARSFSDRRDTVRGRGLRVADLGVRRTWRQVNICARHQ